MHENTCIKALVDHNLGQWTLERGLRGYYLKHPASGTYLTPERTLTNGYILYLTTGLIGMEFVIDGNPDDGYV
jgi:hypothetical protein